MLSHFPCPTPPLPCPKNPSPPLASPRPPSQQRKAPTLRAVWRPKQQAGAGNSQQGAAVSRATAGQRHDSQTQSQTKSKTGSIQRRQRLDPQTQVHTQPQQKRVQQGENRRPIKRPSQRQVSQPKRTTSAPTRRPRWVHREEKGVRREERSAPNQLPNQAQQISAKETPAARRPKAKRRSKACGQAAAIRALHPKRQGIRAIH